MATRQAYVSLFQSPADATEFEAQALDLGGDALPDFAKAVRAGGTASAEYWDWLIAQLESLQLGEHEA